MELNWIKYIEGFEVNFIRRVAILLFITATAIVITEVLFRYSFSHSFIWAQEIVIFFAATAAFLYFGITQKESGHLSVNILQMLIKNKKLIKYFHILSHLISISFCLFFSFLTLKLIIMFYSNGVKSISSGYPIWTIYACLFIGYTLLIINFCKSLCQLLKRT